MQATAKTNPRSATSARFCARGGSLSGDRVTRKGYAAEPGVFFSGMAWLTETEI